MIIFGTKGCESIETAGEFFCPQCNAERRYEHKKVRRYFTLYFIPLIPLDELGSFVECKECSGTFKPEVLKYDPKAEKEAFLAEYQVAARRVMVVMMLADGQIDDKERETIKRVYKDISGADLSDTDLRREITEATREKLDLEKYLKKVAPTLNDSGKELLVKAAALVAAADGAVADSEREQLVKIASLLELSKSHLNGILNEVFAPE